MSTEVITPEATPEAPAASPAVAMPEGVVLKSHHTGTVTRVDLGGALVHLEGVDGYVHISKMLAPDGGAVTRVADHFKAGDPISVYVTAINAEKHRVDLDMRKPPTMDWSDLRIGGVLENVKVVAVEKFGAFVDFDGPKHGLVPFNLMTTANRPKVGDVLEKVWVMEASEQKRRVGFTMIEPPALPWESIKKGDVFKGKVARIERNGAYIEIGAEREGLLKAASFGGGFINVGDFVAVGEEIDVRVTFVDPTRKRIDLKMEGINPEDMALSSGPEEEISPMAAALQKARAGQRGYADAAATAAKPQKKQRQLNEALERTLEQLKKQKSA
ncbi:MAG: S1 RNA-binding domain-containing protein [Thermoflexales bacterium]|nr:S1 RNA-binding domain-containing protein [Thermoflexales bacterium]